MPATITKAVRQSCYKTWQKFLIIFYSFHLQLGFELRSLGPMATIPSAESPALPRVALTLKMTLRFSFFLLLQQRSKFWKPIEATDRGSKDGQSFANMFTFTLRKLVLLFHACILIQKHPHTHTLTQTLTPTPTLTHTHTYTHSYSRTSTLTHTHTLSHTHAPSHKLTHTHDHSYSLTLMYIQAHALPHSRTLTLTHSHTLILTHTHTNTHTNTH